MFQILGEFFSQSKVLSFSGWQCQNWCATKGFSDVIIPRHQILVSAQSNIALYCWWFPARGDQHGSDVCCSGWRQRRREQWVWRWARLQVSHLSWLLPLFVVAWRCWLFSGKFSDGLFGTKFSDTFVWALCEQNSFIIVDSHSHPGFEVGSCKNWHELSVNCSCDQN